VTLEEVQVGSINRGLTLAVAAVVGCASASAAPTLDRSMRRT
jgi:hypothetical protein